ncbi:PadR family transcriptional regulator [Ktedonosporobacter rubrisoli]|nr:PadR family transcriptional regulator [Ktedonosporobacter rubrisoli]
MYEFIILSLLMVFPGINGYSMTKIANDAIGPWVKISNGTLYPLLTKLEQLGLIERVNPENAQKQQDRHSHAFVITETGKQRFHQLMMETTANLGDYQRLFYLKMMFMNLLNSDERLFLFDHYINYCQMSLLHCRTEARDFERGMKTRTAQDRFDHQTAFMLMQHKEKTWQAEADWAQGLRNQLKAQAETKAAILSREREDQNLAFSFQPVEEKFIKPIDED